MVRSYFRPDRSQLVLIGEAEPIHEAGTLFIDPGATWSDDRDGSGEVDSQTSFDSGTPGVYSIYEFFDATGSRLSRLAGQFMSLI